MKWSRFTIETNTQAEDFISEMLSELGVEGVQIEDNLPLTEEEIGQMFVDFPLKMNEEDQSAKVSFYIEEGKPYDELLKDVRIGLERLRQTIDIGSGNITSDVTEDIDWINNWKKYFSSFNIGDILIKPTWEEVQNVDKYKCMIEIDPGISFGTGKHETTYMCIEKLSKYINKGDKVLDVGFGSGILSIASLKLGAADVTGTDVDYACLESALDNIRQNHLTDEAVSFYIGNICEDEKLRNIVSTGYDLVVANILADIIVPMKDIIYEALKPQGIFISSGIIDFKESFVTEALIEAGFNIIEVNKMGEWVCIVAQK